MKFKTGIAVIALLSSTSTALAATGQQDSCRYEKTQRTIARGSALFLGGLTGFSISRELKDDGKLNRDEVGAALIMTALTLNAAGGADLTDKILRNCLALQAEISRSQAAAQRLSSEKQSDSLVLLKPSPLRKALLDSTRAK